MTGLENILNGIKNDAELSAEKIIKEAEEHAAEIIKNAEAEAEKILSNEEKKAKLEAENIISRAKSNAELNAKRIYLSKKQKLIFEIINAAKEKLASLSGEEYLNTLKKLIEKNANTKDAGEVLLSSADKAAFEKELAEILKEKNLKISEKTLPDGKKGCIIVYSGAQENCTFDEIFDANEEYISDKIQEHLFD